MATKPPARSRSKTPRPGTASSPRGTALMSTTPVHYDVTALQLTIYYNREGDHDHNGMMFALAANVPVLKYVRALARSRPPENDDDRPELLYGDALARAQALGVDLPATPAQARQPHPLVRPLVLRARVGDTVTVTLENQVRRRAVGIHLVSDGYDVTTDDGSHVGGNPSSLAPAPTEPANPGDLPVLPYPERTYTWACTHEGVFPFHDGGNYSGEEDGTNVHGLFGALVVEPAGTTWRDPANPGLTSHGPAGTGAFRQLDGLHLDVLPAGTSPTSIPNSTTTLDNHAWGAPQEYVDFGKAPHREFVVFFHDEPEFIPPHAFLEPNPCGRQAHGNINGGGGGGHGGGGGGHGGEGDVLPIMPVSYRAEPMVNRERELWRLVRTGHDFKGRPVLNEEQHHSSWMFGDPVTSIFKAYIGDPVRIRFVHAGTKETHVFHLHLYEWHAVAGDESSPRIDAISVSPQTGHTIEPVWGAGNRHQVAGDVIWHCHLYPHFHEGMWGMFRTFETRQDGADGPLLSDQEFPYTGRRIGRYPDGTRVERLLPLPLSPAHDPNRKAPPKPTAARPGYPLYIPGEVRQKSPVPPWPDRPLSAEELGGGSNNADPYNETYRPPCHVASLLARDMPSDFDYRPVPTDTERRAFNARPVPGELFTRNRLRKQQAAIYNGSPTHPFRRNEAREVCHDMVVAMRDITYNSHGWHDKQGHLYYLEAEGEPATRGGPMEPLFFRANHGQIVNVTLRNALPPATGETEFDHAFPPCAALPWEGECAPHVHMVKFDPICADGASVGWNYMSGARVGRRMVYRWWADQEFGTIFFHDHLFANYRQKHGLFGALLVEPAGSTFWHHAEPGRRVVTGAQALVRRHPADTDPKDNPDPRRRMWFREFCVGVGDFVPMWDRLGRPLNPPAAPGGHGDQGVMGLNYRNAPVRERPGDPAYWFSSRVHGDPDTTVFHTYADDPVWVRLVQGSHEEQHSFQVHGLRWRRFRANTDSSLRNQQSLGISEAFTLVNQVPFGEGDFMYKLSGADDLWLGCWGLIRSVARPPAGTADDLPCDPPAAQPAAAAPKVRKFWVAAERQAVVYRDDIVDPFGLVYRLTQYQGPDDAAPLPAGPAAGGVDEPLVLWCRDGERVEVALTNDLPAPPPKLTPEPRAPEVPVERADRPVSSQVSMHADLVTYDVRESDGANAGLNPPQTVPPGGGVRTYGWETVRPEDAGKPGRRPLGPVLLQDMADFRNHRHHGLVGALVVLPAGATPHPVADGATTAAAGAAEAWHGARVTVSVAGGGVEEHMVLLMQDGLRLFLRGPNGEVGFALPDPPQEPAGDGEKEDQGSKAFNYRTEPRGPVFDPKGSPYTLAKADPATPVWHVDANEQVRFHLVGACDKPRQYSFTIHGVAWPEHRFQTGGGGGTNVELLVSSESAISCGSVRTLEFAPAHAGDHAFRSGVLKWAVPQGMWGLLRVH